MSVDIYAYWRAAVAGKPAAEADKLRLPTISGRVNGEDPQFGLWKVRQKKGEPPVLMQIWWADPQGKVSNEWDSPGKVMGTVGGKPVSFDTLCQRWLYAEPASKDEAAFWRANGRWPADPPPINSKHNLPADPFEALKVEVEDRLEQAKARLAEPITDQIGCDKATNYQRELLGLIKRADAMHKAEKAPILEAAAAVDNKFRFRDSVRHLADALRNAVGTWLALEERRQETERAAAEAERARKIADDPVAALTDPEPSPAEPIKVRAGGGVGKKAGLRSDWDIEFVDYKLAALQVIEDPEICVLVGKIVLRRVRAAKGCVDFPGIKIKEIRRAT